MAPSESPVERSYSFISDPSHKETLSGRVTAACLNCRRKKIKCSGGEKCQTCRDKGLLCEGPPKRKRPGKEAVSAEKSGRKDHSSTASPSSTTRPPANLDLPRRSIATTRHSFSFGTTQGNSREGSRTSGKNVLLAGDVEPIQQESFHLCGANSWPRTSGQEEHPSASQGDVSSMLSPIPRFGSIVSFDTSNHAASLPGVSPNVEAEEWSFLNPGDAPPNDANNEACVSEISYNPYISSAPRSPVGHEGFSPAQPAQWWSAGSSSPQAATDLISTAELLEEQARSLRQMASSHDLQGRYHHPQTTSLPSSTLPQVPCTISSNAWGSYDDAALLQGEVQQQPQQQPDFTQHPTSNNGALCWPGDEASFPTADLASLSTARPRRHSSKSQAQRQYQQQQDQTHRHWTDL
nr:hypothetical protein CFP56_71694 [Quercus suber]